MVAEGKQPSSTISPVWQEYPGKRVEFSRGSRKAIRRAPLRPALPPDGDWAGIDIFRLITAGRDRRALGRAATRARQSANQNTMF